MRLFATLLVLIDVWQTHRLLILLLLSPRFQYERTRFTHIQIECMAINLSENPVDTLLMFKWKNLFLIFLSMDSDEGKKTIVLMSWRINKIQEDLLDVSESIYIYKQSKSRL